MSRGREAPMDFEMSLPQSYSSNEKSPWLFYASSVNNYAIECSSSPTSLSKSHTNPINVETNVKGN